MTENDKMPYFPKQHDLNDLIRDLNLTKSGVELITSRLRQWNLLDEDVKVTVQRNRQITVFKLLHN